MKFKKRVKLPALLIVFLTVQCMEYIEPVSDHSLLMEQNGEQRSTHACGIGSESWLVHGGHFKSGQARYADVNGDGRADLIYQGDDNKFYVSLGYGDGRFASPRLWAEHGGRFVKDQAQYADFNGDGKSDLVFRGFDNRWWFSLSTGCGFDSPKHRLSHGGPFHIGQAQYPDFNGDGKNDIIFRGVDNRFWLSESIGDGFHAPRHIMTHGGPFVIGQTQYADVNGDSKDDLIFQGIDNGFWVSTSDGNSFSSPQKWAQHGGPFYKGRAQYPDLNGDGMADLVYQGEDNAFWVSLSSGDGFSQPVLWVDHGGNYIEGQAQYADLTGDGRDDLIFQGDDNRFWVSVSLGNSLSPPSLWYEYAGGYKQGQARYADLNGDSKFDLVFQTTSNFFSDSISTGIGFSRPNAWGNFVRSMDWPTAAIPQAVVIVASPAGEHNDSLVMIPGETLLDTNGTDSKGYKEAIDYAYLNGVELYIYSGGNFSYPDYWDCVILMKSTSPCSDLNEDTFVAPWPQNVIENDFFDESVAAGPLEQKANSLDTWNVKWHQQYYGAQLDLVEFTDNTHTEIKWHLDAGDSALHSGIYLASQAMRYHVTKSPEALENAQKSVQVLSHQLRVTGRRGYLARYRAPRTQPFYSEEWCDSSEKCFRAEDNGPYAGDYWLGRTSRDMYKGWIFGMTIAYDLVDDETRETIRKDVYEVITELIRNDWQIIDQFDERATSSADITFWDKLSFAIQGYHVTGDREILSELKKNLMNIVRVVNDMDGMFSEALPTSRYGGFYPNQLNHMVFYNLLRLGKFYFSGNDQGHFVDYFNEYVHTYTRLAHTPFHNVVYMTQGGWQKQLDDPYLNQLLQDFNDLSGAPATRANRPGPEPDTYEIDPVSLDFEKVSELLLKLGIEKFQVEPQALEALPIPQQCVSPGYQENPFKICEITNERFNDRWVESGQTYLVPYWMARYYGIIPKDHGLRADDSSTRAAILENKQSAGEEETGIKVERPKKPKKKPKKDKKKKKK